MASQYDNYDYLPPVFVKEQRVYAVIAQALKDRQEAENIVHTLRSHCDDVTMVGAACLLLQKTSQIKWQLCVGQLNATTSAWLECRAVEMKRRFHLILHVLTNGGSFTSQKLKPIVIDLESLQEHLRQRYLQRFKGDIYTDPLESFEEAAQRYR